MSCWSVLDLQPSQTESEQAKSHQFTSLQIKFTFITTSLWILYDILNNGVAALSRQNRDFRKIAATTPSAQNREIDKTCLHQSRVQLIEKGLKCLLLLTREQR